MFIEVVCIRCTFSTLLWRCFEFSLEHIAWYLFDMFCFFLCLYNDFHSISRMAINVDCTFQFLLVQWVVIAIIALKFGEVQRSQVRWILDIAEDNMLMMVFLAISKYRISTKGAK